MGVNKLKNIEVLKNTLKGFLMLSYVVKASNRGRGDTSKL